MNQKHFEKSAFDRFKSNKIVLPANYIYKL